MYYGPAENSHVTNYRMALTTFPLSLDRKKWSKAERENLGKGIRQQFQEMVLQISVDQFRYKQGFCVCVCVVPLNFGQKLGCCCCCCALKNHAAFDNSSS